MTVCDSKLRTLIVGGSGFIGSRVVTLLSDAGGRVISVLGRSNGPMLPLPAGVQYIQGDVADRELVGSLLQRCDEVIDLSYGTVPKTSYEDPVKDIVINLPGSVSLIEQAALKGLRRFVLISSGGTVYGPAVKSPIPESHLTNPISPYGITKLAVEKYALMFNKLHGLQTIILRPSNPFGPAQNGSRGQGFVAAAMGAILNNKAVTIFGDGTIRDYIYIDDLASGIVAALNNGIPGEIYNIGSGRGLSNFQVLERLDNLISGNGCQIKVERLPARGFDVMSNVLDITKINAVSGWSPKYDFDTALKLTWDAMVSKNRGLL